MDELGWRALTGKQVFENAVLANRSIFLRKGFPPAKTNQIPILGIPRSLAFS